MRSLLPITRYYIYNIDLPRQVILLGHTACMERRKVMSSHQKAWREEAIL